MCRNLFYTVDGRRMQGWPCSELCSEQRARNDNSNAPACQNDATARSEYNFLNDPEREDAVCGWARGIVRHAPNYQGIHLAHRSHAGLSAPIAAWVPPRDVVMLHDQVPAEAQVSLITRGKALRSGSISPRDIGRAERAFIDGIKPLLGIWYGRLMLIRTRYLPWLIAQIDPLAWIRWVGCETTGDMELLRCPPPASILWDKGHVVEMFGAETSDLCCCSLVDSPANRDVLALDADFLDALALTLTGSPEGTVFIDIDADYAERTDSPVRRGRTQVD